MGRGVGRVFESYPEFFSSIEGHNYVINLEYSVTWLCIYMVLRLSKNLINRKTMSTCVLMSPFEIKEALNQILDAHPIPGVELRVGFSGSKGLELRLEFGSVKSVFPIVTPSKPGLSFFTGQPEKYPPGALIVSLHISDGIAQKYREVIQVNHADYNGRLFIRTEAILIDRAPRSEAFSNKEQTQSPFSLKASRIARILLEGGDREWLQRDLQTETGCSPGYVSRVLKELVREGFVRKEGSGAPNMPFLYRVANFSGLLSAWEREDRFYRRVKIVSYSVLESDVDRVALRVRDALEGSPFAFTQWYAAWLRHPHTTPPLVSVYVPEETLRWFEPGRRVDTGGNLRLLVPEDEGVFQGLREVDGFPLVSDAQIYLDLIDMGQRGPDAARSLRKWEGFGIRP